MKYLVFSIFGFNQFLKFRSDSALVWAGKYGVRSPPRITTSHCNLSKLRKFSTGACKIVNGRDLTPSLAWPAHPYGMIRWLGCAIPIFFVKWGFLSFVRGVIKRMKGWLFYCAEIRVIRRTCVKFSTIIWRLRQKHCDWIAFGIEVDTGERLFTVTSARGRWKTCILNIPRLQIVGLIVFVR